MPKTMKADKKRIEKLDVKSKSNCKAWSSINENKERRKDNIIKRKAVDKKNRERQEKADT